MCLDGGRAVKASAWLGNSRTGADEKSFRYPRAISRFIQDGVIIAVIVPSPTDSESLSSKLPLIIIGLIPQC